MPSLRLAILALALAVVPLRAETTRETVVVGGVARTFALHVPGALAKDGAPMPVAAGKGVSSAVRIPRRPAPLVIAFHGSGADGAAMERFSKFSVLADREGFIVAYPDAVRHEWNDGRAARSIPSQAAGVDDVAFVDALITKVSAAHRVDSRRIFATGFSNGGIFAHYLGSRLSHRLAAIAPVSGGIAEPVARQFKPAAPLSVCIIHGAADRAVPYGGGNVDARNNGRIIGTEESAALWTQQAGNFAAPSTRLLADTTPADHRRVTLTRWAAAKAGAEVVLYTIEDGGHAWPSGPELRRVRTSRTFDATQAIWSFFRNHPKA